MQFIPSVGLPVGFLMRFVLQSIFQRGLLLLVQLLSDWRSETECPHLPMQVHRINPYTMKYYIPRFYLFPLITSLVALS